MVSNVPFGPFIEHLGFIAIADFKRIQALAPVEKIISFESAQRYS